MAILVIMAPHCHWQPRPLRQAPSLISAPTAACQRKATSTRGRLSAPTGRTKLRGLPRRAASDTRELCLRYNQARLATERKPSALHATSHLCVRPSWLRVTALAKTYPEHSFSAWASVRVATATFGRRAARAGCPASYEERPVPASYKAVHG
jgi:hypothetical protein